MRRSLSRWCAVALACGLVFAACSSGSNDRPTVQGQGHPAAVTTTTLPAYDTLTATPIANKVTVYAAPDVTSAATDYPNPWPLDNDPTHVVPQVFLVEARQEGWVKVLLPVRPNGTAGWVHQQDVRLNPNPYRIDVSLGAHQITVHNGDSVLLQEPVAIGAPKTPTPPGRYYLRVLLKAPDPNTVYGPYAYGLSAHSEVLTQFNGGDGEVGIHGNDDARVLGTSITHGCVRMSNDGITRLAGLLPLGTPVQIT